MEINESKKRDIANVVAHLEEINNFKYIVREITSINLNNIFQIISFILVNSKGFEPKGLLLVEQFYLFYS